MTKSWLRIPLASYPADNAEPQPSPLRDILLAVPALITGVALLVGMIVIGTASEGELLAHYRSVAAQALHKKEFATAQMCYERLVKFYGNSYPEYSYDLARADLGLRETERAVYIM